MIESKVLRVKCWSTSINAATIDESLDPDHVAHFDFDRWSRTPEENRDERFWDCETADIDILDNSSHLSIRTGKTQPFKIGRCYDLTFRLVPEDDDVYLLEKKEDEQP